MKSIENFTLAFRWIGKRPVESLLLVIGIALGVGAVSAGLSLYMHTKQETQKLIASTKYREIVVTTREEADEMERPAVPIDENELAVLTTDELAIRNEIEGIQYAFIANQTEYRLSGGWGGPPGGGPRQTSRAASDDSENSASEVQPPPPLPPGMPEEQELPKTDSPDPALDTMYGYEVTPEFFAAQNLVPASGSLFTAEDLEKKRPIMVLGSDLAEVLFSDGVALGREVYHRRELYEITGILEPSGTEYDTMALTPAVIPDQVFADSEMARMFFLRNPTPLHFIIGDAALLDETKARLASHFEDAYGENSISISLPREEAESMINRNKRISIIIMFLAISGLLIADVNVSNILLGRMIRSKKKIGILKAIGAGKRDIFGLFAIEGFLLSAGGAVVGTGVSYLLFRIMKQTLNLDTFSPAMLIAGIIIAWIVTMALTLLPAVQASKVAAADAMRHE